MNTDQAEQATGAICAHVDAALAALQHPRTVNGHGVLSSPWREKTALSRAYEEIGKALRIHATTTWPTLSDYRETAA